MDTPIELVFRNRPPMPVVTEMPVRYLEKILRVLIIPDDA